MFLIKCENEKHALESRKESAYHGVSVVTWPSAIQHSKSAKRHSKSVEWHSSCAKWHAAPLSNIHAILHSQTFFLELFNI